jgi:hypothetical protein
MSFGPNINSIPTPGSNSLGKTLVLDLACSVATSRYIRNVMNVRAAVQNPSGGFLDQQVELTVAPSGGPISTEVLVAPSGNAVTVVSSDSPVHILVTLPSNEQVDLGLNTLFIVTTSILNITLLNTLNLKATSISCIIV